MKQSKRQVLLICALLFSFPAHACDVSFDCASRQAKINGKTYPIICGHQTGRGISDAAIGSLIHATGPWRPGLVAPGTPMIATHPSLCYDCFIHVSDIGRHAFSNGCIGTTAAAFNALKSCNGSKFSVQTR
jgi:hypothetical protein